MKLEELMAGARRSFSEVWHYTSGKVGLVLLVLFVAVSLYALVVMPANYRQIWNDVRYWRTNPQAAPPSWVSYFGVKRAPHLDETLTRPDKAIQQRIFEYTATYVLNVQDFPQRIVVGIKGLKFPNIPGQKFVVLEMDVVRPDNVTLKVAQTIVRTEANETIKYLDKPYYFEVDSNRIQSEYRRIYGITVSTGNEIRALFGQPTNTTGQVKFEPYIGTYKVIVKIQYGQGQLAPGENPVDEIRVVVVGNIYGLMGTDTSGRDLAEGLLYGFPVALAVGLVTAVAATAIGVMAGIVSGYYGGWVDEVLQRLIDVMGNVPLLPFLILLVNITPVEQRLTVIMLVLIVFGWGGLAIIIRSMTLSIKSELYIEAARAVGAGNRRIIFRHILPQVLPYAMATLVFSVPGAVLAEAGLSVIGLEHGWPTWGKILADARSAIAEAGGTGWYWWWIMPPGILLSLMSLTFVLLGMAIETIVEPRLRRRA